MAHPESITLSAADLESVTSLLASLGADIEQAHIAAMPGEPRSKARPRFNGKGQVYSDRKQREHETALRWHLLAACPQMLAGNLAVVCLFFRSNRLRIDTDNMVKQVLDAANKVCWQDDYQVTGLAAVTGLDVHQPRTIVAIAPHVSTLIRSSLAQMAFCANCGEQFEWHPYASQKPARFCSRTCSGQFGKSNLMALVTCLVCHQPFKRINAKVKICSEACRLVALEQRNRAKRKHPQSVCDLCGTALSRPEYRRCRECWKKVGSAGVTV